MLREKSVEAEGKFEEGDFHSIETHDSSKSMELCKQLTRGFVLSYSEF